MGHLASPRAKRCLIVGAILLLIGGAVEGTRFWAWKKSERQVLSGLAALEAGDWEAVAVAVESLADSSDFRPHAHLLRGALLVDAGSYTAALEELDHVGPEPELQFDRRVLGIRCLVGLGRRGQAEVALRKLAVDFPNRSEPHRRLAAIYHDRGAIGLAKRELEEWIRIEPDNFLPYRQLALLYHRDLAHSIQAIESYRKALALDPPGEHGQSIREELSEALVFRREYEAALEVLQDAQETAKVLALRAECCWSLGRRDQAWKHLENAIDLDPGQRFALLLKARIHMHSDDPEAAAAALKELLARDPHDYVSRYQLVQAYSQMGDPAAAERELERMERSKRLRRELAELYVEAINEHPNDPAIREQMARLCDELGKPELAARWRWAAAVCREAVSAGEAPLLSEPETLKPELSRAMEYAAGPFER